MKIIDALGIECPMPVIMAKRVIKEGEENFIVLVDNEVATQNLTKLGNQTGFTVNIKQTQPSKYEVEFTISCKECSMSEENADSYVVVFDSNTVGEGDEDFGKKLIESFLLALTEQDRYPEFIICYNLGIELTTINSNTVEDLEKLEKQGVKIYSCGLCLDHYKLKEQLKVGEITNMYRICEIMTQNRVVKP